jgi:hypothetical protein
MTWPVLATFLAIIILVDSSANNILLPILQKHPNPQMTPCPFFFCYATSSWIFSIANLLSV